MKKNEKWKKKEVKTRKKVFLGERFFHTNELVAPIPVILGHYILTHFARSQENIYISHLNRAETSLTHEETTGSSN